MQSSKYNNYFLSLLKADLALTNINQIWINVYRIAVDPIFPPPPIPNSKKYQIPDALDNRFELVFNERDDAAELKNLPIDDNMQGIIEEEELDEEGSDEDEGDDNGGIWFWFIWESFIK